MMSTRGVPRGRVVPDEAPLGPAVAVSGTIAGPPPIVQGVAVSGVLAPQPIVVQPSVDVGTAGIPTAYAVPGAFDDGGAAQPVTIPTIPVIGTGVPSGVLGRWLSDPFDAWCSSAHVCLTSACCICFPLSEAARSVGLDEHCICRVSGALWTIHLMTEGPVVFWYFPWCLCLKMCALTGSASIISSTRAKTAERDQIPIAGCDMGFSFCCGPCAVSQMTIHNRRRFSRDGPR